MKRIYVGTIASLGLLVTCFAVAQEGKGDKDTFLVKFVEPNRMNEDVEIFRRILNHKLDLPRVSTFPTLANPNLLNQPGTGLLGISGGGLQGGLGQYGGIGGNLGLNGGTGALGGGGQGLGGGISSIYTNNSQGGMGANSILTTSRSSVDYPDAEGVYLKGYGVIYHLVLPPQPKPQVKETKPPVKPVSDWDRVSKEMHGEKVTGENKPAQPREPTLTEILIKLLAENGHHFAQLGEKENITIVITFREARPEATSNPLKLSVGYPTPISLDFGFPTNINAIQSGNFLFGLGVNSDQGLVGSALNNFNGLTGNVGSGSQGANGSGTTSAPQVNPTSSNNSPGSGAGNTGAGTGSSQGSGSSGSDQTGGGAQLPSSIKDILLLADLHFKQGKFAEAEALYRKTLEALPADKDSAQKTDILRKLAQIFMANGKDDEAKHLLERILAKKGQEATKPVQKEAPKPLPLPAKLIITAPKELLHQVATNRIDLEAFSKAVSVEYENTGTSGK